MKYFLIFLTIIFLICFFLLFLVWFCIYVPKDSNFSTQRNFLIENGQSVEEISHNLEEQGFIKHSVFFGAYLLFQGKSGEIKAGNYELSLKMNIPEIVEKFISGDTTKKTITIIEGWDLRDIGWYFENQGMFIAEEFFEITGFPKTDYSSVKDLPIPIDFSEEFDFLKDKPKNVGLEGYLFPDTYYINELASSEATAGKAEIEDIVRKMLVNFGEKLNPDLRQEIAVQDQTIFEIITMASLIEKEVRTIEDKKIVAGILYNRLEIGMPLQVCATIAYITGKKSIQTSLDDLTVDSRFNTYKYKGLPLGPISNPGFESILATIYPKESEYFYYLSTPEGKTIFNKTLDGHNRDKAKYLK
ncbi:MAG: endolytic transglycosylase MltG [Patescibacteria group bacterium]|nr:endolytic transglycosylase MltG [Patescibacteria group bacterium]